MLTYEALIEQAESRNMPKDKLRGILREYIQTLILKEIYKTDFGKSFYFMGGSCLRFIYNLKRFSEDLDFNAKGVSNKDFKKFIEHIADLLRKTGFEIEVDYKYRNRLLISGLRFFNIEDAYGVAQGRRRKSFMIKVEANRPEWDMKTESKIISGFGEIFPVIAMGKGPLFSEKLAAFINVNKARHIYDVVFMIANKFPIDMEVMEVNGLGGNPKEIILKRINSFQDSELKRLGEGLRPFLFDEREADLVKNAKAIIADLLSRYRL